MIKKIKFLKSSSFLLIILAFILIRCNDDLTNVGLDLLPDGDIVGVGDTIIYIDAYTIGSVAVSQRDSLPLPLGVFNDPDFGKTKAAFMLEFSPRGYVDFDTATSVVTSVTMELKYRSYTGDSLYFPVLEVYRLSEGISKTETFYTDFDDNGKYIPDNLASSIVKDSVISGTDTSFISLITLNNNLGEELINIKELSDTNLFKSYSIYKDFVDYFKGLYIRPVEENGQYSGLHNIYSVGLIVDYISATDTGKIYFDYLPNISEGITENNEIIRIPGDRYIKVLDHEYSALITSHLNDTVNQDTAVYIQSLGGPQVLLKFNGLESLRDQLGNVLINKAELFIPVYADQFDSLLLPIYLGIRPLGDYNFIPEDRAFTNNNLSIQNRNYMGGVFDQRYTFYLTKYFQDYFDNKINNTRFKLFAGHIGSNSIITDYNTRTYERISISNGENKTHKIALKLVYTQL